MKKSMWLIAWLMFPLLANAALYKWVDENGSVHFSDRPIPQAQTGQAAQQVEVQGTRSMSSATYGAGGDSAKVAREAAGLRSSITFYETGCLESRSLSPKARPLLCDFQKQQYETILRLLQSDPQRYFAEKPKLQQRLAEEYAAFQKSDRYRQQLQE